MTADVIAIALGLLVGLSLGALGGGGSTLAVPILVFVAGLSAQDATTASLLVVGIASAVGVVGHLRNGNVHLTAGVAFGAAGIVGSRIGLLVNRSLDEGALLLAFSALIAVVAALMYRSAGAARSSDPPNDPPSEPPSGSHEEFDAAGAVATEQRTTTTPRLDLSAPALAKLAGAATAVGLLTGLFGVGGGFAIVPALTLLLGYPTKQAIGTSLVVIVINALIALGLRIGDVNLDWTIVGPFLATVTIGVLLGTAIAKRIDADQLTRGFALMLAAVAIYTAASTLAGA